MNPGEAVGDALDVLAAERTTFLSLPETVAELGGNRKAAEAFGVTIRTVQRWLKLGGGQQRQLARSTPAVRAAVARVQRGLAGERMRADMARGFAIVHIVCNLQVSKTNRRREQDDILSEEPDEEDVDALIDAWLDNDKHGMATAFDRLFTEAWGHGTLGDAYTTDIDGLVLAIGQ